MILLLSLNPKIMEFEHICVSGYRNIDLGKANS